MTLMTGEERFIASVKQRLSEPVHRPPLHAYFAETDPQFPGMVFDNSNLEDIIKDSLEREGIPVLKVTYDGKHWKNNYLVDRYSIWFKEDNL